ncbi:MAG: tRNA threonylcarbamoyladenosine dehydratase [Anaeromicrobium sp.]|jgi:tRNA A37 threonylcarbamoyladenosine dehydratase|uniref:tRNA threonylcarbamoyladenosine dehydratase n=1 Tax=Anaeromicrobium sp. TaxID=1929132 RepID=UPI0025FD0000|nr:tRNA threonylcarbamoyladenosine dehydratase [Anaeromicrobium sp.]MCT4595256.1 tRNA threonylcarbamoyladenosine dehydratase [Anaeromicrobium sp.]
MLHEFSRTEMVIGKEGLDKLKGSKVLIFGVGGVGSFVAEGLARCGVGHFVLCDDDEVCLTNINRQIHATRKTVGKSKVEVMKERILDINPKATIETYHMLYNKDTAEEILPEHCDYVVDAIDMVSAKLDLIERCNKRAFPIISSMGTGNKLNPTMLEVTDIHKTSICPLARVMRKELRNRRIKKLKVVYSKEQPITPKVSEGDCKTDCICPNTDRTCVERRSIPGSVSFVPSVAGLIIASEVVKDLVNK